MMKIRFTLASVLLTLAPLPSTLKAQQPGQAPNNPQCGIPIHKSKDVDRKAKILAKPSPDFDRADRRKHAREVILLSAILCGSGEVTDIKVKNGLSDTANTKAIEAAHKISFIPGEKGGEKVSTLVTLVYRVEP